MDWMGLAKGVLQPWVILEHSSQMYAAAILQLWMKDVYEGSHQEYNDTMTPFRSM